MRLICDDFKFSSWNRTAAGKRTLARKAADAIRISPAGSPVASSRAMEAPLNPAVLESPQERHTDWASVVALITCIGVFGLALGLKIGIASGRERVGADGEISVVAGSIKKKTKQIAIKH